jgi:uncharacterized membrane protein YeaQ/YmgE (transglycosylase-associated protein family)
MTTNLLWEVVDGVDPWVATGDCPAVYFPLWVHWVILGFIAGALAKFLMPGRDPSGCIVTTALGIVGAFIGGLIASKLGWGPVTAEHLHPRSLALATLGAIVVLLIGRLLRSASSPPSKS